MGTTDRGDAIMFTVSPDQAVRSITSGYRLNGCSGTIELVTLSIPITEFPGATGAILPGFQYVSGRFAEPDYLHVAGSFTGTTDARGLLLFDDYRGCGSGVINWAASRR